MPFDHNGEIAAFEPFEPQDLVRLPTSMARFVRVGDLWIDVFLWEDYPYVGTPTELWAKLQPHQKAMAENAPLTLLDLGSNVEGLDRDAMALQAFTFLQNKFGPRKARQWRDENYLRFHVIKSLYSSLRLEMSVRTRQALQDISILEGQDKVVLVEIPQLIIDELSNSKRTSSLLDEVRAAALPFNLTVPAIVPPRQFDWDEFRAKPEKFIDWAAERPLLEIASFFASSAQRDEHSVAEMLWRALAARQDELCERALMTPPSHFVPFINIAMQRDQKTLVNRLWDALTTQPERASEWALNTTFDDLSALLKTADQHSQKAFVAALWRSFSSQTARLAEQVFKTNVEHVGAFLKIARQHGQQRFIDNFWSILAAEPTRLIDRSSNLTPRELMSFLVFAPTNVKNTIINGFKVEDWADNPYRAQRFSTGAPGLAGQFGQSGREDLKSALIENILRRKNPADFGDLGSALTEMSRLISFVRPDQEIALTELLKAVCTERWLDGVYKYGTTLGLAGALHTIAANRTPNVVCQFWHHAITTRLRKDFANPSLLDDQELSAAIQFLGASSLSGWAINRRILINMPLDRVGNLARVTAHRQDARIVEPWQRQLWLGLRVAASIGPGQIFVDSDILLQTLSLWHKNIDGTDDWLGTKEQPNTTSHRINVSMVEWLELCSEGRLVTHREPLWLLAGFPRNPRELLAQVF